MNSTVYLYVFDTMADWEVAYLNAELHAGRYFKKGRNPLKLVTISNTKAPIVTMGGLRVIPDIEIDELIMEETAALILPGGNTWTQPFHEAIIKMARECLMAGAVVGAICGATMGLAESGILDQRWHTSNDLEYLKMTCPNYVGEKYYKKELAVTDGNLITATGIAPLEFTLHILKTLNVFSTQTLDAWYNLYKTQESKYFHDLMNSIQ
ncbi:MAG: type 1 glutamine amidotransferase family protein [Oscillospiraceae bacterium]